MLETQEDLGRLDFKDKVEGFGMLEGDRLIATLATKIKAKKTKNGDNWRKKKSKLFKCNVAKLRETSIHDKVSDDTTVLEKKCS